MSLVTVGVYPASQGRQGVWDGGFRLGNSTYATWEADLGCWLCSVPRLGL
jgi:hypothetical protein